MIIPGNLLILLIPYNNIFTEACTKSKWADLITAHPLPGPEMITHLFGDSSADYRKTCGCVLILEMGTNYLIKVKEEEF